RWVGAWKTRPGAAVSSSARATATTDASGAKPVTPDFYCPNTRPSDRNWRQDRGGGGGGVGGGGGDQPGQLSQQQREIIAGTFNTLRDRASKPQKELQEDLSTLRVAQQKVHGQVDELARRIVDRGIGAGDRKFAEIAQSLGQ